MTVLAPFPEKLQCLFVPKRYKVLYGGRGAGRSWGCARALLLIGAQRPIRVLCVRELQNSIVESVHKLLSDQIAALGLDEVYEIQAGKIINRVNGTTFSFEGIRNNSSKIKSYEGIDYCWMEEADRTTRSSWGILIPTIRKEGSEIWMTFNPGLITDYTYQRFVVSPSEDSIVVKMTFRDNPWFPEVLERERIDLLKRDPDEYDNVWEGNPVQMLQGVVFAKELKRAQGEGRITKVPWDEETPVDVFWDLGRHDLTSMWFVQRVAMQTRVLDFFEDSGEYINYYLKHCQSLPYVYNYMYLPHDAKAKRIGEKRTIEQITRAMGFKVVIVPRATKKVNAINAARIVFPNCYFDAQRCAEGLNRLRRYRYNVVDGQLSQEPLHDENSNAADAFMAIGQARGLKGPSALGERLRRTGNALAEAAPRLGWLGQ